MRSSIVSMPTERRTSPTGGVLHEREAIAELRILPRERASDDVRVPAQILRRRVEHEVGAELGGLLQIRARECVVYHGERMSFVRDLGERGDIEHFEQRI